MAEGMQRSMGQVSGDKSDELGGYSQERAPSWKDEFALDCQHRQPVFNFAEDIESGQITGSSRILAIIGYRG